MVEKGGSINGSRLIVKGVDFNLSFLSCGSLESLKFLIVAFCHKQEKERRIDEAKGKAGEEGEECGIVKEEKGSLGTWARRKERGWRDSGTLHGERGSFRRSSEESTFCTLSRRLPGVGGGGRGARPGPPSRFPPRTLSRQPGQPVCRHRSRPG